MTVDGKPTLGIGMVGYAFMGAAHSQAWRNAPSFFDLPLVPRLAVLAGRNAEAAGEVAGKFGWGSVETDWQRLVARDDVGLVDICTPGDSHADIAIAALEAGKHVLCEKPLANSVAEAEAMAEAAEKAGRTGVRAMVGFTYRRVPALALARRLITEGAVGDIRHVRAQYLQDWIADADAPFSWRLDKTRAGSGALGDIGAHIVDLTQYLTGEHITGVSALLETFVHERPVPEEFSGLSGTATAGAATAPVTVDDAALFLARFTGGAVATFEATRFAAGRKNALRVEINGTRGGIAFDLENMNVLDVYDHGQDADHAGFTRVLATEPSHPYIEGWWPPGHLIGYEHSFTHQAVDLLTAIAESRDPEPTFADGLRVQRVLAAVETSAANDSAWTPIPE